VHHEDRNTAGGCRALIGAGLMLVLAGCGASNPFPLLSSGPSPRVEDCMLLQQATPTRFVCGGKIYTAVQLADIRNGNGAGAKP
jgi:hypothetical protein